MSNNCAVYNSSIGKKVIMAITGALLFGFLIPHLAGNFLMFCDAEAYNNYSHALVSNPLIYVAEFFLVAVFLGHIVNGIILTIKNKKARPVGYAMSKPLGEKSIASQTMIWSGLIVFYFLVIHLVTFKFGTDVSPPSSDGVRDIYSLVVARFSAKDYSIFYIMCMIMLGFHLSHAIQSLFRTLGLSQPKYLAIIKSLSIITGIAIAAGYSIFPIYFGFIK